MTDVDLRSEMAIVNGADPSIAAVEAHEAMLWRRCFEEVDRVCEANGSPRPTIIASVGSATVYGMRGLSSREVNRVLGLGLNGSSGPEDVVGIAAAYHRWGITRFQLEVADWVLPSVEEPLRQAGLVRHPDPIWVNSRPLDEVPDPEPGPPVQILDASHAGQVAALQRRAWGFWEPNAQLDVWFSATLGRPGFTHFGLFLDEQLACMGALFVDGEMGWAGFDATLPRARNLGLRGAFSTVRIRRAAELGCRLLHGESYRPSTERRGWRISHLKSRWVPRED